jgi:hypothetical protein
MVSGYENLIEFKLEIFKTGKHTLQFKFSKGMYYSLYENKWVLPTPSFALLLVSLLSIAI